MYMHLYLYLYHFVSVFVLEVQSVEDTTSDHTETTSDPVTPLSPQPLLRSGVVDHPFTTEFQLAQQKIKDNAQ